MVSAAIVRILLIFRNIVIHLVNPLMNYHQMKLK